MVFWLQVPEILGLSPVGAAVPVVDDLPARRVRFREGGRLGRGALWLFDAERQAATEVPRLKDAERC